LTTTTTGGDSIVVVVVVVVVAAAAVVVYSSLLQRVHGDIGHANSDVQSRDEQADKQTYKQI